MVGRRPIGRSSSGSSPYCVNCKSQPWRCRPTAISPTPVQMSSQRCRSRSSGARGGEPEEAGGGAEGGEAVVYLHWWQCLRGARLRRPRTGTSCRRERKCDREARPPPGSITLGSDLSTVKLHQRPHDGEAEANAANGPCGHSFRLTEPLEDVGQEVSFDPTPSVRHDHVRLGPTQPDADVHAATLGRELDRVRHEIREHLVQTQPESP